MIRFLYWYCFICDLEKCSRMMIGFSKIHFHSLENAICDILACSIVNIQHLCSYVINSVRASLPHLLRISVLSFTKYFL